MFAPAGPNPTLEMLLGTLHASDMPVSFSVSGAGPATPAELASSDWEAAFVRWEEPEVHDTWYLERGAVATDEAAQTAVAAACVWLNRSTDRDLQAELLPLLLAVNSVVTVAVMPAMTADDDHPAWDAFADLVQVVAGACSGIAFAPDVGFYDSDGVLMGDVTVDATQEQTR
ncbi:MAG: hypothetical protein KGJ62_04710 [Armatimonadetes bacterium]|nr:hypothetical protein [Armatimonadota bacterium]MDE2205586.1 hypothetical protein [Armatimonadota bacterium]